MHPVYITFFGLLGIAALLGIIGCFAGFNSEARRNVCCGAGFLVLVGAICLLFSNKEALGIREVPDTVNTIQVYSLSPPIIETVNEYGETVSMPGDPAVFYYKSKEIMGNIYYTVRTTKEDGSFEDLNLLDRKTKIVIIENVNVAPYCVITTSSSGFFSEYELYIPASNLCIQD